jgi:microcystin degradation protein MlrC
MPRVGIVAFLQESNTFLSRKTTFDDFANDVLVFGEDVRARFEGTPHEVGGFFEGLKGGQVSVVPIFAARAYPYGTILKHDFDRLLALLRDALRNAGPLDGLLVAPHGATVSEVFPDADGCWLRIAREIVGPRTPIIGTLDPHANLSPLMVSSVNAFTAYRTNPHIDQKERGLEAAELMLRTLRGEIRPTQAACFPPMIINIERQCTDEPPLSGLVARVADVRERPNVLSSSLMLGFPYADVAEMGSATLVVTDNDPALARRLADELGREMWNLRRELAGNLISVSEAVARVDHSPRPVCLLDMGDNVGGGSPADGTLLAWELHRQRVGPAFVCLYDPAAVRLAEQAGAGQRARLSIGGKSDGLHGPPLEVEVTVRALNDGAYRETETRHGGFTKFDQGRTAIVETDARLTIMITSRRALPFSLKQLTTFGLDPLQFKAIVAKGVNAPLAAYRTVCPTIIRVNTPGVTTAEMSLLTFHHRRRPMFPCEPETEWAGAASAADGA